MTLVSDALPGAANINNPRIHSGMDMPLNQLDEVNESVNLATVSNDDRAQQPARGGEILMETGSRMGESAKGS